MSRDIKIELSKDDVNKLLNWKEVYTYQSNCNIEIIYNKEI